MTLAPEKLQASPADIDGVAAAVHAYIEGWVKGDAEWHASAYHPECVKRRLYPDEETGVYELATLSPQSMVDYAATGRSVVADCEFDIVIDDISDNIASVRCYSCRWVDFIHLVKARGEWRLFHVTWHHRRETGGGG